MTVPQQQELTGMMQTLAQAQDLSRNVASHYLYPQQQPQPQYTAYPVPQQPMYTQPGMPMMAGVPITGLPLAQPTTTQQPLLNVPNATDLLSSLAAIGALKAVCCVSVVGLPFFLACQFFFLVCPPLSQFFLSPVVSVALTHAHTLPHL